MKGNVDPDQIDLDQIKHEEAIILSMTLGGTTEPPSDRDVVDEGSVLHDGSGSSVFRGQSAAEAVRQDADR